MTGSESDQPEVQPGQRWRHFKGGEYTVLHVATNAETDAPVVVYRAEYGDHGVYTSSMRRWRNTVLAPGETGMRYVPRFELVESLLPEPRTEIMQRIFQPWPLGYLSRPLVPFDAIVVSERIERDDDNTGFGMLPEVHWSEPEVYVVIGNNPDRLFEVVRVIEHDANSSNITVKRGADHTIALNWSMGETWRMGLRKNP